MSAKGPDPKQELQPVVIRLPVEMHQQLKDRAAEEERTMAQTVRRALKRYLEQTPAS